MCKITYLLGRLDAAGNQQATRPRVLSPFGHRHSVQTIGRKRKHFKDRPLQTLTPL
jgi:hypothetical protein